MVGNWQMTDCYFELCRGITVILQSSSVYSTNVWIDENWSFVQVDHYYRMYSRKKYILRAERERTGRIHAIALQF